MRRPIALLSLVLLAPGARAAADDPRPRDSGISLALGAAYAVPAGDLADGGPALDTLVSSKTPIWLEVGYRFSRRWFTNLFLEFSPAAVVDSACPPADDCSATGVRFGVTAQLHLRPGAGVDPWVGLGAGVETLETRTDDPSGALEARWAGFEALATAGVDFALGPRVAVGPFVAASFGQYTSFRAEAGGTATTERIDPRAGHAWLEAGARVRLDL